MIIVAGYLLVDTDARDGYLTGCTEVLRQARAAAGCLEFVLAADPLEPGRIIVFERWESDARLAEFRGSGPSAGQVAEIRDASVARYRISSVEPA